MKDLERPALLYAKAILFLALGGLAVLLLMLRSPELTTFALIALAVWAFCRVYYFAFYVIERYIDDSFRFSGLLSAAWYVVRRSAARSRMPRSRPGRR